MTDLEILQDLDGTQCRCGKPKERAHTFCRRCYNALPKEKRRALYRRFREGYEEAFRDAVQFLVKLGHIVEPEPDEPMRLAA